MDYCSPGLFDLNVLNSTEAASKSLPTDFSLKEFVKGKENEWDIHKNRYLWKLSRNSTVKLSRKIVVPPELAFEVPKSSTNKQEQAGRGPSAFNLNLEIVNQKPCGSTENMRRDNIGLRDRIRDFILQYDGPNNMYCATVNFKQPSYYYSRTVINFLHQRNQCYKTKKMHLPKMIIITENDRDAKAACTDICKAREAIYPKKNAALHNSRISVRLLVSKELEENIENRPSRCDIVIGSAQRCFEYLHENIDNMHKLQKSVRYLIVEQFEKFSQDHTLARQVAEIIFFFGEVNTCTNKIFFEHFKHDRASSYKYAQQMCSTPLLFEYDTQSDRQFLDYVKLHRICTFEDFDDALSMQVAEKICSLNDEDAANFTSNSSVMHTELWQKLTRLKTLIEDLRLKRTTRNARSNNTRAEKILILTRTQRQGTLIVAHMLGMKASFSTTLLTILDSEETAEDVNFAFRGDLIDVVVVDYKSLHDINRGIVDAVIVFDLPPLQYFAEIMENELERLISRDCVRIKLHILVDENNDISHVIPLCAFMCKYSTSVPMFLKNMLVTWKAKREALEISRRLQRMDEMSKTNMTTNTKSPLGSHESTCCAL